MGEQSRGRVGVIRLRAGTGGVELGERELKAVRASRGLKLDLTDSELPGADWTTH